MKKTFLFIMALSMTISSFGQNKGETTWTNNFSVSLEALSTYKQHDIRELGARAEIGYEVIPNLTLFARYENSIGIYKSGDARTHFSNNALGGGFEYKFAKINNTGHVGLKLAMLGNVGSNDWKKTIYDANVTWKMRDGLSPSLALGFRQEKASTLGIPNMNVVYGSIGICF